MDADSPSYSGLVVEPKAPVFADGGVYSRSHRHFENEKREHRTGLWGLDHSGENPFLESEVMNLRKTVHELKETIRGMAHEDPQGEIPSYTPPTPKQQQQHQQHGDNKYYPSPTSVPYSEPAAVTPRGMSTSHAEFSRRKRMHNTSIRSSPGKVRPSIIRSVSPVQRRVPNQSQQVHIQPPPATPPRREVSPRHAPVYKPDDIIANHKSVVGNTSRDDPFLSRRPCAPHVSNSEFTERKRKHRVDMDSPARRRASELQVPAQQYQSIADGMTGAKKKPRATWPEHLPVNAFQMLQGKWVSGTRPIRRFEIRGEAVVMDGEIQRHPIRVGNYGIALADVLLEEARPDYLEWNDGDVWTKPGYHPNDNTPPSPIRSPPQPKQAPRYVIQPHSHSSKSTQQQQQPSQSQSHSQDYHNSQVGPVQQSHEVVEGVTDTDICPSCGGSQVVSPYCSMTGQPHTPSVVPVHAGAPTEVTSYKSIESHHHLQLPPTEVINIETHPVVPHITKGRCPLGHKLQLQSSGLGDVCCSSCELILPAARFAGCRTCDYDVCDICLGCNDKGTTVVIAREPDEGTGAICGANMLLEEVIPNSPADLCGCSKLLGKRLTHINDVKVGTVTEACEVAQDAETVKMTFV